MSFKDKANEVLEQGRADRANYSPEAGSVPLKMYQFWANERPRQVPPRENFCHYWRVVAIWAPLWFVATKVEDAIDKISESKTGIAVSVLVILGALALLISLGGATAWGVVGIVLGSIYTIAAFVFGIYYEDEGKEDDVPFWAVAIGTVPALLGVAVTKGYKKFAASPQRVKRADTIATWILKIAAGAVALVGIGILGYLAFQYPIDALIVLGILAGLVALVFALAFIGSYLNGKYKANRAARTTYTEEAVYDDWPEYTRTVEHVEPSKIAKFFMHIGDFLVLAFQVVRVKKWKICPIVEIPDARI